ncbi:hypothetical protein Syun_011362 [Stephania yunnanensis]|uniref:Protein transport protein Sec61 subunit beta n=2 Tax=Stephania TaxID=147243 RepID=A0AAP0JZS9_9MAGN
MGVVEWQQANIVRATAVIEAEVKFLKNIGPVYAKFVISLSKEENYRYMLKDSIFDNFVKMAAGAPPRGSAAAAASLRRRRTTSAGAAGGAGGNMLQFYTDDAPGLKISPNVVLVMSIGFIAFVAILHVIGKLYLVPKASA